MSRLRHYEVMVILDAGLDEDAIREIVDRATLAITNSGGSVDKVDRWGKRRFAYEVHHRSEGYYVLVEATAEPAAVDSVDRVLGLADEVIRHKVIRLPDKAVGKASATPASTSDSGNSGSAPAEVNANGAN
ncbi:MAG TPA: 30S ribosomal protein S6 [Acidimicrobiales bacterium]|nr:30S ribosomal protein S6 [Acidimicrobiales bacterium]